MSQIKHFFVHIPVALFYIFSLVKYRLTKSSQRKIVFSEFLKENQVLPEDELKSAIKKSSKYFDTLRFISVNVFTRYFFKDNIFFTKATQNTTITGKDTLDKNLDKGVILISFHVGPFTLLPFILMQLGYKVNLLMRSDQIEQEAGMTVEVADQYSARYCKKHNYHKLTLIDSQKLVALLQIRKALARKEIIIIFPDTARDSSVDCKPVSFFNQKNVGHVGLIKLLNLTKAELMFANINWHDTKYQLNFKLSDHKPKEYDESDLSLIYDEFEKAVRANPEQWIQAASYHKLKY